jgi:O-antigen biosynthesis protein
MPDASLRPLDADGPGAWCATGERPCFRLPVGRLAAGWYFVDGLLEVMDEIAARPAFYPGYAGPDDGDASIPLPLPDPLGRIRAVVLFKYDVTSLAFAPGLGPAHFRMQRFSLRKVGRVRALASMLLPGQGEGMTRSAGRCAAFLRDLRQEGLSPATARLFGDYQRRLLPPEPGNYETWLQQHDTLTTRHLEVLRERSIQLGPARPLISVLLPVYRTPETWLRRCIDSVLAQVYENWQLCIVDDASPDPRVMEVLREYAATDPRIEVCRRATNGHISEASNTALHMARGEFVALLDHDDELRPHALLEVAEALLARPDVSLVYSDEDKIDAHGRRFDPYFKPDWDPDLLRSQNYVCHLTVLRTSLVRDVGGFRRGFEGSQDHDLVLRCSERLSSTQIHHIARILYHWRAIPGSTALSRDAKDYAAEAGLRAVDDHLRRLGSMALAEALSHGHYRVRWPLPNPVPKVSVIVPTRDQIELLRSCVESVLSRTTYPSFEVVVVDNRSSDPAALAYLESLSRRNRVRVLRYDHPFNYSALNNWAVSQCDGDIVCLLNNDIEVITPDWLEEMVGHACREEIGAVGAMLYYPDGSIQHAGVILGVHGVAAHAYVGRPRGYPGHGGRARVAQRLSAVTGACMVVRRTVYARAGGLDEGFEVAFNDIDFCLRLRALGYANVWTPLAELYHHESASRGSDAGGEKRERFIREIERMRERWGEILRCDPAYNPNLSLGQDFGLASPPRHADADG